MKLGEAEERKPPLGKGEEAPPMPNNTDHGSSRSLCTAIARGRAGHAFTGTTAPTFESSALDCGILCSIRLFSLLWCTLVVLQCDDTVLFNVRFTPCFPLCTILYRSVNTIVVHFVLRYLFWLVRNN